MVTMGSFATLIILSVLTAKARAEELSSNDHARASMTKLPYTLVNELIDRMVKALPLQRIDLKSKAIHPLHGLDHTMLGKPGNVATRKHPRSQSPVIPVSGSGKGVQTRQIEQLKSRGFMTTNWQYDLVDHGGTSKLAPGRVVDLGIMDIHGIASLAVAHKHDRQSRSVSAADKFYDELSFFSNIFAGKKQNLADGHCLFGVKDRNSRELLAYLDLDLSPISRKTMSPYIKHLMVAPKVLRQGLGTSLLKKCQDHVAKLGYDVIYLHCGENQIPALELYKKMGFSPRKRIYSEDQERHLVLMKKTIRHSDLAARLDDVWPGDILNCDLPDSRVAHLPGHPSGSRMKDSGPIKSEVALPNL